MDWGGDLQLVSEVQHPRPGTRVANKETIYPNLAIPSPYADEARGCWWQHSRKSYLTDETISGVGGPWRGPSRYLSSAQPWTLEVSRA
jgi:hypothetical protein